MPVHASSDEEFPSALGGETFSSPVSRRRSPRSASSSSCRSFRSTSTRSSTVIWLKQRPGRASRLVSRPCFRDDRATVGLDRPTRGPEGNADALRRVYRIRNRAHGFRHASDAPGAGSHHHWHLRRDSDCLDGCYHGLGSTAGPGTGNCDASVSAAVRPYDRAAAWRALAAFFGFRRASLLPPACSAWLVS